MSQPNPARRPRSVPAIALSLILRTPLRLLALTARGLRLLLIALMCGILSPPNIEEPPLKNPAAQVEKQRR